YREHFLDRPASSTHNRRQSCGGKMQARGSQHIHTGLFARALIRLCCQVPLMLGRAAAGFPSPADDYLDRPLDFNELLIENPDATFAVRVVGDSMIGVGIFPGDIAVVDR